MTQSTMASWPWRLAGGSSATRSTYALPAADRAEVAVEVADDLHHLGLATLLMIRLAQFAEEHQIPRFFAEVLRTARARFEP